MTSSADEPLVSVVMACHNSERYVRETIASVLDQTYRNLEFVAVDDCSTDATVAILQQTAARDARLRVVQRGERGGRPAITKNTALEHVQGRYVCFVDHDDLYLPTKVERLVGFLERHRECVAAFHDVDLVDHAGQHIERYLPSFLDDAAAHLQRLDDGSYLCDESFYKFQTLRYAAIHTISVMIARDRFPREALRYDTRYVVCDDTDLWIRLGMHGRLGYVDEVLAQYRQHASNITRNQLKLHLDAVALMEVNRERLRDRLSPAEQARLRQRIADVWATAGWLLRAQRAPTRAAAAYLRALRSDAQPKYLGGLLKAWLPAGGGR